MLSHKLEIVSSLIKEAKISPALARYIKGGARARNMSFLAYARQLLKRRKAMRAQGISWNKNTNAMEWGPNASYGELGSMTQTALQRHALLDHSPFFRSKSRHAVLNELEDLGNNLSKYKSVPAPTKTPAAPSTAPVKAPTVLANDYRGIKSMVEADPALTTGAQRKAMVQDLMRARNELAKGNIYWNTEVGRPYMQVKDVRHYLNDADISDLRTKLNIPKNVDLNQLMYDLENLAKRKSYLASTRSSHTGARTGIDYNARFSRMAEPTAETGDALSRATPTDTSFAGFIAKHPMLAAVGAGGGGSFIGYKFKDSANTSRMQQEYAMTHGLQ